MAVSQHAWKASTPRGTQFDRFSRSQGPPPKQELHRWSQSSPHSHRWKVPGASRNRLASVKNAHFVAGEYGGPPDSAYLRRRCWAKRQHFTWLESQIGPLGEAVENNFNAACGLWPLCWVRGRVFGIVMSCLLYLILFSNDLNLGKFRWIEMNLDHWKNRQDKIF